MKFLSVAIMFFGFLLASTWYHSELQTPKQRPAAHFVARTTAVSGSERIERN